MNQKNDDPMIECQCGKKWWIDYTPTPEGCEDDIWRIWVGDEPGIWVDPDGNKVDPKPNPKEEKKNEPSREVLMETSPKRKIRYGSKRRKVR